jgi:predicted RNA-binding protein with PIN domain
MPAAPRYLIVDGHSVIHAWDDLRALHERDPRGARRELERRLTTLHDTSEERIVLVFDGRGRSTKSDRERPVDIQVIYSARGATADAVIEKLVSTHAPRFDLTVVTADEAERTIVSGLGAWVMSPAWLRERIESSRKELDRQLKDRRSG